MSQKHLPSGHSSLKNSAYLSVQKEGDASYGGNQTWFSSPSIRGYGCGLIAAHDFLWYLNTRNDVSGCSEPFKIRFADLTHYHGSHRDLVQARTSARCSRKSPIAAHSGQRNSNLSWEAYESSLKKLRPFFPILPRLGINGLMLSGGLNLYFLIHRLPYHAVWNTGYRSLGKKITQMLQKDLPVILSIGSNFPLIWKKDRLSLYKKTADGTYIRSTSTRAHYVTVTGIEHGWLRISSWGQEWYINWNEYRTFSRKKSCPLFSNICYIRELG